MVYGKLFSGKSSFTNLRMNRIRKLSLDNVESVLCLFLTKNYQKPEQ